MALGNYTGGLMKKSPKQFNDVKVVAQNQISIGDTVYTIQGEDSQFARSLGVVNNSTFSPDGTKLILVGYFIGRAKIYSVSGTTVTFVSNIYADAGTKPLDNAANSASFSPDGTKLVIGGDFTGKSKIYSVSGTTVTYVSNIYADNAATSLSGPVTSIAFSPDGTKLVLGGDFSGKSKLYSISEAEVSFLSNIYADAGTTALSANVKSVSFSPDGTKLVLGGSFSGGAKIYSVSANIVTYVSNIYADSGTTALSSTVFYSSFSPDGTKLVLGGYFSKYAKWYSVSGTTITYVSDLYSSTGTTELSWNVLSGSFSPDGSTLILAGQFTSSVYMYSVSESSLTYLKSISGIYSGPYSALFSPLGNLLLLSGNFSGGSKLYSVSGTTVTYVSYIYADNSPLIINNSVNSAAFSPDGTKLVLVGSFTNYAKLYSVYNNIVTFVSNLYANSGTTPLSDYVSFVTFSPDGSKLVIGGHFTGYAKIYSVSTYAITYLSDLYSDSGTTALSLSAFTASFSPDGTKLVLGGYFSGYAKFYSVSGTTVSYISDIYSNAGTTALSAQVNSVIFSPDGTKLILVGLFTGYAKHYSIYNLTVTYISDIYSDTGTTALSAGGKSVAFNPAGTILAIGGSFSNYAKLYSVSETTIAFLSNIYSNNTGTSLSGTVYSLLFIEEGNYLLLGGPFSNYAKIYRVTGSSILYLYDLYSDSNTTTLSGAVNCITNSPNSDLVLLTGVFDGYALFYDFQKELAPLVNIYADVGTTALSSNVNWATFSPDGTKLVLGGLFTGKAKIYSVSENIITYVSDIYADTGTTALSDNVYYGAFSPDGTKLVLGGSFTGKAKIYSVSGTQITYISDIYADTSTTLLSSNVYSVAFSPDGTKLVLGGSFTGRAKIYSISGTIVTYLSDVYASASNTTLSDIVNSAAFSQDGTKIVLGGSFTGRAKIYSVSGTIVTYLSEIYADVNTTYLSSFVTSISFSPDGTKLVLGGYFSGGAKLYSVSELNITYISDIYADSANTTLSSVKAVAFSTDGSILIIGGDFSGFSKQYLVSGSEIQYISNLTRDGLNPLSGYVSTVAFSSIDSLFVLNFNSTGFAKSYYYCEGPRRPYLYRSYLGCFAANLIPVMAKAVGYSKRAISKGKEDLVRIIASLID